VAGHPLQETGGGGGWRQGPFAEKMLTGKHLCSDSQYKEVLRESCGNEPVIVYTDNWSWDPDLPTRDTGECTMTGH